MFHRKNNPTVGFAVGFISALIGFWLAAPPSNELTNASRRPANAASDYTSEQLQKAEWSVAPGDFESSAPQKGRSYFDLVFSRVSGNQRVYDVPYPFNKVIRRLESYLGHQVSSDGSIGPKVTIFPMGRSLQRNAAVIGTSGQFSFDPFFRYPRIVVGVDEEPNSSSRIVSWNIKNKLYVGFNERSQLIEAISYNEEDGRYEYQIVKDYQEGLQPKVVYANRQLCLSCHQNQTPIFSRGPWSESNSNPIIVENLRVQLTKAFGEPECDGTDTQKFCAKSEDGRKKYFYFGAALQVDQSVPYAFDVSTDQGNYLHAYQKLWQRLCSNTSCQKEMILAVWQYLLNGQDGLVKSLALDSLKTQLQAQFSSQFPFGLKIPDPNIPNRDPMKRKETQSELELERLGNRPEVKQTLQELVAQSSIPGEFEPLLIRQPMELWPKLDWDERNLNKLLSGLADLFTGQDVKNVDSWLRSKSATRPGIPLNSNCAVEKSSVRGGFDMAVECSLAGASGLRFKGYFEIRNNKAEFVSIDDLLLFSPDLKCDLQAVSTPQARLAGMACPAFSDIIAEGAQVSPNQLLFNLKRKNGLNLRLLDGRLLSSLSIQFDEKAATARLQIFDDMQLLSIAVEKLMKSRPDLFANTQTFPRAALMYALASDLGGLRMDSEVDQKISTLPLIMDQASNTTEDILTAPVRKPTDLFVQSCSMCHLNREGVPPPFLGSPDSPLPSELQCERIEQCAPRMMYRIRMRYCTDLEQLERRSPMPMEVMFLKKRVNAHEWLVKRSPQMLKFLKSLIQPQDLSHYLRSQDISASEADSTVADLINYESNACPRSKRDLYEHLPRCDFSQMNFISHCERALQVFETK